MAQQVSPFLEAKYGWNYGESAWNTGADENFLKFSFLFDGNVDDVVASLPAAVNGQSHFLTTDNRFYFAVGTVYYSAPCPKWFIFKVKSTGIFWQFDGSTAVEISNPVQANAALEALQDVVDDLGTAAFQPIEFFATQAELDVAVANAAAYTDALRTDLADSVDGSDLVGFRGRTVYDKLNQWVDVRDFGAVGDYSYPSGTDDTAAFQGALDYIESVGGGTLYIPKGVYRITAALNYSDVPLQIIGAGVDNSVVVQTTATASAFNFTSTLSANIVEGYHGGRNVSLTLRDFSLSTPVVAGTAFNLSFQDSPANAPFLVIDNVQIKSLYNTIAGFVYGIYAQNLNGSRITNYRYDGDAGNSLTAGTQPFQCQSGIRLTGTLTAGNPSHFWSHIIINNCNTAVHVDTWYEGIYMNQFEFVQVGIGFAHQGYATAKSPNTFLATGHMDFKYIGLSATNVNMVKLVNVDFFKNGAYPVPSFNNGNIVEIADCERFSMIGGECQSGHSGVIEDGISLSNCKNWAVIGVDFIAIDVNSISATNSNYGRVIGNNVKWSNRGFALLGTTSYCTVSGNNFEGFAGTNRYGVILEAGTSNNIVTNNTGTELDIVVNNAGSGNLVKDNYGPLASEATFTASDTTPSVTTTGSHLFTTANGSATSINTFDQSYIGQEITVIAGDANTTIVNAAAVSVPIYLRGGANQLLPLGGTITFKRVTAAWYETSRSF